jgi:two-component system CheB/CheR fusion protein
MANQKSTQKKRRKAGKKRSPGAGRAVRQRRRHGESPAPNPLGFYTVALGASAGGLEALEEFFSNMPADSGMAFVVVPHLDPSHKSLLTDLLTRYTRMNIVEVKDGMRLERNRIYIIPPNKYMYLQSGVLRLLAPPERHGLRHPIDHFFRSLAQDQKDKAVGIVLSGTGSEGALGLRAIKGEGGVVLAQKAESAKYEGMPASAIATGLVDEVLSPSEMPKRLLAIVKAPTARPVKPAEQPTGQSSDLVPQVLGMIKAHTGNDFTHYKQNTIRRRIERRMAIHQIGRLSDYLKYLKTNPQEIDALFKELLIRVTDFFRDPATLAVFKRKALPLIFKGRPAGSPVRIWVPGCSTGEEAYSIAMLVHEYMQKNKRKETLQIFATDIDAEAIEIARTGVYTDTIPVDVSAERLKRYFVKKDSSYSVRNEIRDPIVFAVQNIIKDPPFSKLDLICCRNVLIYLDATLQRKVIPLFHYALNPHGLLFLGSSETIGDSDDLFSVIDRKHRIFRRRPAAGVLPLLPTFRPSAARSLESPAPEAPVERVREAGLSELTRKLLLEHYAPPCVIVNEQGTIFYFQGRTGQYLEPATGKASLNIFEMTREGLRYPLRALFRRAVSRKEEAVSDRLTVKANGSVSMVQARVKPITEPNHLNGLYLVVFQEVPAAKAEKAARAKAAGSPQERRRIADLEHELKSTREHLQTTIEELETSNEELKSTNEELESSNEELQSTNEEMETSREELQSVNEELTTVNSELQGKFDELSQANNDMNNLLASVQGATLFLDTSLHIKRFTPAMTDVFNLIQTDIGRPVSDLRSKLTYPELVADAKVVLKNLGVKEKMVKDHHGNWFQARIAPYRTMDNVIGGLMITFINVNEQTKIHDQLMGTIGTLEWLQGVIEKPSVRLDGELRVVSANTAFYRMFKVTAGQTERRFVYDLGDRQWDNPALKKKLREAAGGGVELDRFAFDLRVPGFGKRSARLSARRIPQIGADSQEILLVIENSSPHG